MFSQIFLYKVLNLSKSSSTFCALFVFALSSFSVVFPKQTLKSIQQNMKNSEIGDTLGAAQQVATYAFTLFIQNVSEHKKNSESTDISSLSCSREIISSRYVQEIDGLYRYDMMPDGSVKKFGPIPTS